MVQFIPFFGQSEATAECLRRYRMLPPHRMAALWSLVASRMLRQEEQCL
jgi:hypothetical protein